VKRLIFVTLLSIYPGWATAGPDGRYQAIPIDGGLGYGTEKALILDTVAGHLWIWIESPAVGDEPGGRYVIYQGQVAPGTEMGEVMLKQEWPPQEKD
jgi:hypothetical protein